MKDSFLKRVAGFCYAAIILFLVALFFTNDFGLVDLRKTSVIIGVGVDFGEEGDEMTLTAQLAVPRPAENGENTEFTVVTGKGTSVARALNEINVKTGFYPKLVFCKLIIIGESCFGKDINSQLNYFFSNEYTGLTPKIAACKGKAEDLFSMQLPFGDSATDSVERLLSDEAQKSANVSTVNLNQFGQGYYSKSGSSYMPYIETNADEEEENESGGESGGGQSESQSGGGQSGGSGDGAGGQSRVEFSCGKTAIFNKGVFAGLLDKEQVFAFNLLNGEIRRTFVGCGDGETRTLSIRNCDGGVSLKVENGVPVLKLSFSAAAKVQDDKNTENADEGNGRAPDEALRLGENTIREYMESMLSYSRGVGCDLLGVADLLYKKQNRYYETLKDSVLQASVVVYEVNLRSAS